MHGVLEDVYNLNLNLDGDGAESTTMSTSH